MSVARAWWKYFDGAPAGLHIASLAVIVFGGALVVWLVTGRDVDVVVTALFVGIPPLIAASLLLHRERRRGAETAASLQGIEARVSDIVESTTDPIVSIDEAQRVILFNAAAERAFQWPRASVLGQPVDMLIPQRFRDRHREHVRQFAQTGVSSRQMGNTSVLAALRANGEEFPIEASISQHVENGGRILTVILRDITERQRAEHRLSHSEARLRGVLDSAMDAIITVDANQKIVLFNRTAEKMFLCTQEEAVGAPLAWLIPDRYRGQHGDHVRAFGATGVSTRRMGGSRIVTGLRRNGEEFPIDAAISQIDDAGAKLYTVILRDVTERELAAEEVRRAHIELRNLGAAAQIAREEEKKRVARELHDELGGSLTMLQMDVSWCKENLPSLPAGFAAKLDRMERVLKSTAAATRRIAADLRPLMLDDLGLGDALEWLVQDFSQRTGIECALSIDEPAPQLSTAHSTAVFRIVQESLSNIAKHANASRAQVVIAGSGTSLAIEVSDDGQGFEVEAPRKPQSYGLLGLRERATQLRGEARITSAPGQGTRVEIMLPIIEPGLQ